MQTQKTKVSVFWTERFVDRLLELNKKAVKLGLPEIKCERLGVRRKYAGENAYMEPYYVEVVEYEIEFTELVLAGWHLVGVIDHKEGITRSAPGQTMPEQYFNAPDWCDHCKAVRGRNETFVVQHESGEYKQVGRNCLADFLGVDPAYALSAFDYAELVSLVSEDDDEDLIGGGGWNPGTYNLDCFLAYTALKIRTNGWCSRSEAADAYKAATADQVLSHLDKLAIGKTKEQATAADYELGKVVAAWMKQLQPCGNEYLNNLLVIGENEYVTVKSAGYAASAIRSYQREQEQKAAAKSTAYVAEVGTKVEVEVTYASTASFDGAYGVTHKHFFTTGEGLLIVWSTQKEAPGKSGERFKLAGKINKHGEYRGNLQSYVSNPKLVALQ